jgi:hypothetical protein
VVKTNLRAVNRVSAGEEEVHVVPETITDTVELAGTDQIGHALVVFCTVKMAYLKIKFVLYALDFN